jgi:5-methyltetrahydropteroyltriglutamate--homocysteine methyltransferase
MKRSTTRILTTHAGSLPRPKDLLDGSASTARVREATAEVVRKQREVGLDIIDDGEYGKPSFLTYVNSRLGGFEVDPGRGGSPWANSRESKSFPEFYGASIASGANASVLSNRMVCTGPIKYQGHAQVRQDIENFKAALQGANYTEAFLPAISVCNIEDWQRNAYYKTQEEYLFAIADAMNEEYKMIIDAGILLQIDDPRLVTYYIMAPDATMKDVRKWANVRVDALNHSIRGIPSDRIRYHTCYSINFGPRVHDMELKDIVDIIMKVKADAFSFEAANPRHDHEYEVWEHVKRPKDKILIPGVVTQSSILVEHPQLVKQRLLRYCDIVGPENVIAGADCGFATFAGSTEIHPSIAWAKLKAIADGAKLASKEAFKGRAKKKPAKKAAAKKPARRAAGARRR